ncbi:MAG TPA: hypothetical protein DCX95_04220, partial [Elusimicrobia bacterium]|nr:hypothetical protein [Elusimicrobiota bacterium]
MADNNWTILPEFDEGHQNRYIVMVSARSVAADVAKKFPKICSEPFELKNDKYSWGLYIDNSTRDERKNIYKFFLGETDSVQELKKEEEIKEVISDLNNIFSTLTKDEQRHIEEEIPAKIESIEKFAEKKSEEKKVEANTLETVPVVKEEAKPQDVTLVESADISTKVSVPSVETKPEISPPSVSVETKQEPSAEIKIEIERFGESASSSVSSSPAKEEVPVESSPAVKEAAVSSQTAPSSPAAESIKVGYLYPLPSPESLEKFINQLKMITE